MIPMLFTEESIEWTTKSSGFVGLLLDCISCTVTEERNGIFELELEYPVDGKNFDSITIRSIITAIPSPYRSPEPFRVYKIEYKNLKGKAIVYAEHISYDLKGFLQRTATLTTSDTYSLSEVMDALTYASAPTKYTIKPVNFVFSSDISTEVEFKVSAERWQGTMRQMMCGEDGSVVDQLGYGEWELTGSNCVLHRARGKDIGLDVKFGYNLTSLKAELDGSEYYGGVNVFYFGSYKDSDDEDHAVSYGWYEPYDYTERKFEKWLIYDCSNDFEISSYADCQEKVKALASQMAEQYCSSPSWSISVSFVDLNKCFGHSIVPVAKPDLCDIVTVWYEPLGANGVKAEITEIETDVLKETYNEITIGKLRGSLAKTVAGGTSL